MTESTAVGTRGFNTPTIHKYLSIGLLAPNVQAKVIDWVNGSVVPPGSTGELWLRGPGTMKGGICFLCFPNCTTFYHTGNPSKLFAKFSECCLSLSFQNFIISCGPFTILKSLFVVLVSDSSYCI